MKDKSIFSHPKIKIRISDKSHGPVTALNPKSFNNFFRTFDLFVTKKFFMRQAHGSKVVWVEDATPNLIYDCDSLITKQKNVSVGVVTADCLPIVMYEPKGHIVSVTHAGYKGILSHVIENTIEKYSDMGSLVKNIKVGIGPGIGVCCYDVERARIKKFHKTFPYLKNYFKTEHKKNFLDLKQIAKQILQKKGIKKSNIFDLKICTSCNNDKYFSYRKENAKNKGHFVTIAATI